MHEIILHFGLGITAAAIGALPFGLVNLSVVETTIRSGERAAFKVSAGATVVEMVFVLLAVFLGKTLAAQMENNAWISYSILVVLLASGIFFLAQKGKSHETKMFVMPDFIKGMLLNILSVQVLLYWFVAVAYLQTSTRIDFSHERILVFTLAAGLGKMLTLLFYRLMALKIKSGSDAIARKINLIIGTILLGLAGFQLVRIMFF
jgi:threonine/homoserine/homoserine lactone efflux protein